MYTLTRYRKLTLYGHTVLGYTCWYYMCLIITHRRDRYDTVTQNQNNCAETHLGGRDMNAFVSPLATIARALSSTSGGSTALGKGTQKF